jgi:hypothetical protein
MLSVMLVSLFALNLAAANFKTPRIFNVANTADAFAVGDFNADGNLDVALVAGNSTNTVQIYSGDGKGNLVPGPITSVLPDSQAIAAADINNDGKLDLIVGGANGVSVLLGYGNGGFRSGKAVHYNNTDTIAIGDFNRDGKLDLLLNGATFFAGNGDGTFQSGHDVGTRSSSFPVALGDFNGDGKLDFAMLDDSTSPTNLDIVLGNGDGTFQSAMVITPPNVGNRSIISADFNGDGKVDLAMTGCSDPYCNAAGVADIYLGNGDGTFQLQVFTAAVGYGPGSILTADFNGDHHLDILEVNNSSDFAVFTGNGDGTFNSSRSWALPVGAFSSVAVGDFNNDGQPDLITLNYQNNNATRILTLALGAPGPNFQAPPESFVSVADVLATGDFNEDGKLDVVASNGFNNLASVALGQGNGTFISRSSFTVLPPNNSAGEFVVGDFNGDHHLDLVTVSDNKFGQVFLALGNGNGTFQPGVRVNVGIHSNFVAAADVNGDGKLDLVATNYGTGGIGNVQVALGNGDGTFQSPTTVSVGSYDPNFLAIGDLNGDGKPDLLVVNGGNPGSFAILLGNGDGTFQSPSPSTTLGTYPMQPLLVDLNGDGRRDVVFQMNNLTQNLYVFLGNGDGTFLPPQIYNLTGGPSYVIGTPVVADFNGDGRLDIAAPYGAAIGSAGIDLLLGQSDGTFSMGPAISVSPGVLVGGDFNGDGKADIVFNNPYGNMIATLLNVSP